MRYRTVVGRQSERDREGRRAEEMRGSMRLPFKALDDYVSKATTASPHQPLSATTLRIAKNLRDKILLALYYT